MPEKSKLSFYWLITHIMENPNKKNTHVNVRKMMKASVNMPDVVTKHLSGLQYLRIHPTIEDRQIMFM